MNNFISAILIYSMTIIYFLLSNRTIYIYTLKYYSLFKYIKDDNNSLKVLINHLIIYRIITRYIRIHLIFSSILVTANFLIKIPITITFLKLSMLFVIIIVTCDILSLKVRLKSLEDKLYRTFHGLNQ